MAWRGWGVRVRSPAFRMGLSLEEPECRQVWAPTKPKPQSSTAAPRWLQQWRRPGMKWGCGGGEVVGALHGGCCWHRTTSGETKSGPPTCGPAPFKRCWTGAQTAPRRLLTVLSSDPWWCSGAPAKQVPHGLLFGFGWFWALGSPWGHFWLSAQDSLLAIFGDSRGCRRWN